MKKITLVMIAVCLTLTTFAQTATPRNAGNEAMKAKNYPEAVKQYETYFGGDQAKIKADLDTYYNLSTAYFRSKEYDKAIAAFDICIANNTKADYATYFKANCYKAKGDMDNYMKVLNEGATGFPTSPLKKNFIASMSKEYNTPAVAAFNEADKMANAASANPQTYVANMEKVMKKFDEAKVLFEKTLAVDPTNPIATKALESMTASRKTFTDYKAALNK